MQQVRTTRDAAGRFVRSGGCNYGGCGYGRPMPMYSRPGRNAGQLDCDFGGRFQQAIVAAGYGKTPFLPDDVIATLDLDRIENYAQVRCGRTRNPNQCAGADSMVMAINRLDGGDHDGDLTNAWPDIGPLAAHAVYALCREKIYRGMRGEWPGVDKGDLCLPKPVEGVMNDPLYQQALSMTKFRCGPFMDQPRLTYKIAKFLSIAKGRGYEMSAAEVADLKAPPPPTYQPPMMMMYPGMYLPDAMNGGGRRLPARLGGAERPLPPIRNGGGKKKKAAKKPKKKAAKAKRMY
jgi:hypothetical protein